MKISTVATMACLSALAASCSKPAPEAPANAVTAPAPIPDAAPATAVAQANIIGSWVDDENDTYSFAADGTVTGSGHVSMTGSWKADGEDRYAVDLNSPAGLARGVACVSGNTMAIRIGDGSLTLLGRVGADGKPADPDKAATCD